MNSVQLQPLTTPGAEASLLPGGTGLLRLPPGPPAHYRLAQFDDYRTLPRRQYPWQPPKSFNIRARASHGNIPGTWGFGLWNAPLSFSFGFGSRQILPALPNAAWFFFASPENYLSFRDDLPAHGALAATFRSPKWPAWLLVPGVFAVPLLFFKMFARIFRQIAARLIRQDACALPIDPTIWHTFAFDWFQDRVVFRVDGQIVFETGIAPCGPLGLVIWVDNQFAAWRPDGGLKWGVLGGGAVSIEWENLTIS